jgi:hypothetical protein
MEVIIMLTQLQNYVQHFVIQFEIYVTKSGKVSFQLNSNSNYKVSCHMVDPER